MLELQGKFASAKVFTDVVDSESISQVINLLNQPYVEGRKVRMMPDIHAGAECTIGTTMTIKDKLELDSPDYKERAKVATQLAKCRQQRRECKDTVEVLEPLVQFLESDKGKNLLNLMREALGKTRKVEERMETRAYVPRVLVQEETE